MRVYTTIDRRDVRARTHCAFLHHEAEVVAVRPVGGSNLDFVKLVLAELRALCHPHRMLRDVPFLRVVFEGIRRADGLILEAALDDASTT